MFCDVSWMEPIVSDLMVFAELNHMPRLHARLAEVLTELAPKTEDLPPCQILKFPGWLITSEPIFRSCRGGERKRPEEEALPERKLPCPTWNC